MKTLTLLCLILASALSAAANPIYGHYNQIVADVGNPSTVSFDVTATNAMDHVTLAFRSAGDVDPNYMEIIGLHLVLCWDGGLSLQSYPSFLGWSVLAADGSIHLNVGQTYHVELVDDGFNLMAFLDGSQVLSAATAESYGSRDVVYNRGWSVAQVTSFSTVPDASATAGLLLLGVGALAAVKRFV